MNHPTLRRVVLGLVATASVATGLIGFAHTSAGKPLLRYLTGSCPIGEPLEDAQLDAARLTAVAPLRGATPAAARPALVFELDRSTQADVVAWAAQHGVACHEERMGLRCVDVPAGAADAAPFDEVLVRFDQSGRLVSIVASFSTQDVEAAVQRWTALSARVEQQAGAATARRGEATPTWLRKNTLGQAAASFHYADYLADITATNLGHGRMSVRATFQSPLG